MVFDVLIVEISFSSLSFRLRRQRCKNLEVLQLTNLRIDDTAVITIASQLTRLRILDLGGCFRIMDKAIQVPIELFRLGKYLIEKVL